jgi:hypothetical protein
MVDSESSRSELREVAGEIQVAHAIIDPSRTAIAGSSRRARRPQKPSRLIRPVLPYSLSSRLVIRKPESTKNTSTPSRPPGSQATPAW